MYEPKGVRRGPLAALIEGYRAPGLQQRLDDLEPRKAVLSRELTADPPRPVRLHPNPAQVNRDKVAVLKQALADPAIRAEAAEVIRSQIERITLTPNDEGRLEVRGSGSDAAVLRGG